MVRKGVEIVVLEVGSQKRMSGGGHGADNKGDRPMIARRSGFDQRVLVCYSGSLVTIAGRSSVHEHCSSVWEKHPEKLVRD